MAQITEDNTSGVESSSLMKKGGPISAVVIGMAGSGKSTLMQRLASHLSAAQIKATNKPPPPPTTTTTDPSSASTTAPTTADQTPPLASCYCINLDPAVNQVAFGANVDIRDTVAYHEVMTQYSLGPNGAIMTSLNLFATKFDQVVGFIEKRAAMAATAAAPPLQYVLVDTPGQIEAFTWSASGAIVTESLASAMPTVIVYVVDVPRSGANPSTFMANMLYACSVLYRTRLPIVIALTKSDVMSCETVRMWMRDLDTFEEAIRADPSFAHDLARSMSLALEEFYRGLRAVGVSAVTGEGIDDLLKAIDDAADEFRGEYLPEVQRRKRQKEEAEQKRVQQQMDKIAEDLRSGHGGDLIPDTTSSHPIHVINKKKQQQQPKPKQ